MRLFHVGAHGIGERPVFWIRPTTRRGAFLSVVVSLAFFALACLLVGCRGVVENGNGPMGPERVTYETAWPWRVAPADRVTSKTTTTPCGDVETTEECEGGVCAVKPKAK